MNNNPETPKTPVYEMSLNILVSWQGHSLSNAGNNGSNRTMARKQLLANGIETDACSGDIFKHYHAYDLTNVFQETGVYLCPACLRGDNRRAAALADDPSTQVSMDLALKCGLCDAHGFMLPARGAAGDVGRREGVAKHSLIEFSMGLALPESFAETTQIHTRMGVNQMIMKKPARSGQYALIIRYSSYGIGMDTEKRRLVIQDENERLKRHKAILQVLGDQLISPQGATTATKMPHLTGLKGAILIRSTIGKVPTYSALEYDYIDKLKKIASNRNCEIMVFNTVDEFSEIMKNLEEKTNPATLMREQQNG